MSLDAILLIVLIVLLVAGLPNWPYSKGWGDYPSISIGGVLLVVLILILIGRL